MYEFFKEFYQPQQSQRPRLSWRIYLTVLLLGNCLYRIRRLIPSRPARWVVALIFVCIVVFLFAFSYFVKPEVTKQGRGQGRGRAQVVYETDRYSKCDALKSPIEIH
jgi:hypothetical protein